jgi:hypothetical protein
MDVLVSYVVLFVCAVLAFVLYFFENVERERQDGRPAPNGFGWLAGAVGTLGLAALAAMGTGVFRFQEEFGMHSGVPPVAVPGVLWYAVWLCGWEAGRIEGRHSAQEAALRALWNRTPPAAETDQESRQDAELSDH